MNRNQEALKELDSIVEMSLFDNDNDDETYGRVFQYTVIPSPSVKRILSSINPAILRVD